MTDRVMVDIETLGLEPGASIISIGAVSFGPDELGSHEFYQESSLESCQEVGLDIDAGTLEWWLEQDDDVRGVLTGGEDIADVLYDFKDWYEAREFDEIWANSPSFDCEMLEVAFEAVGLEEPWGYGDERDVRTVRNLPCSVDVPRKGDEHNALDDALWQARCVSETLALLEMEYGDD